MLWVTELEGQNIRFARSLSRYKALCVPSPSSNLNLRGQEELWTAGSFAQAVPTLWAQAQDLITLRSLCAPAAPLPRHGRGGAACSKRRGPGPCHFSPLPSSLALRKGPTAARVVASDAGRVGGVGCAASAAAASGSFSSSGAGLWGGRGQTHRPRRDGECGCSARVLRVEERLRDRWWPEPLCVVLEMLFLSVSCFSVCARLASRPRSRPGEEEGAGPPQSVWPG